MLNKSPLSSKQKKSYFLRALRVAAVFLFFALRAAAAFFFPAAVYG
tara:strand:- start:293 stop:430 length:138 start_codon:yes stop_codon:yes gene_type:complete